MLTTICLFKPVVLLFPVSYALLSDATVTRDPRTEPGYAGIRVRLGDVAYFVLADIAKTPFIELMPARVQEDWKQVGVLAYFKFVQKKKNREWFSHKLETWYKAQERPCLMKTSQLPTFFGFRLDMNLNSALDRFREFPELEGLAQGKLANLTFNDRTGRKSVHGWAVRECCVVIEDYRQPFKASIDSDRFTPASITLTFWGKRLKGLMLESNPANWTPTSFVEDVSKNFGFRLEWWRSQPVIPPHDQRWVHFNKSFSFDCDEFRGTALCMPAPKNFDSAEGKCRFTLEDLNPVMWKKTTTVGR